MSDFQTVKMYQSAKAILNDLGFDVDSSDSCEFRISDPQDFYTTVLITSSVFKLFGFAMGALYMHDSLEG